MRFAGATRALSGNWLSKAVLGYLPLVPGHFVDNLAARVPSWIELLSWCREALALPAKEYHKGLAIDCPAEATEIVAELTKTMKQEDAERVFKTTIAKIVDFYPDPEQVCAYQGLLKRIVNSIISDGYLNRSSMKMLMQESVSTLFQRWMKFLKDSADRYDLA